MDALVLIVDDEPATTRLLQHMLAIEGYASETAHDGPQALERLSQAPRPDLVLLDIMMPGLDGFHVLQRIKSDARTAGIPVVMMSARTDLLAGRASQARGASGILAKPFAIADLIGVVEQALAAAAWAHLALDRVAQ
jgi:two-component system OmpR family response regulator